MKNDEQLKNIQSWRRFIGIINPDLYDLMTIKAIFKKTREFEKINFEYKVNPYLN